MSEIKPLDLPSAAGVEYGRGDVRHFSEDDAVDVPGLQNPTRQLAQRDNLLATKLNEVVGVVNNKEQFVPLVIPKTTVPPGTEEIVTNFKIPEGFEARVLNATIGSSPASSALLLKIYYATGYGNLTGTELVSTQNSFDAGVQFYNDGEFIVAIRNNGTATIEASTSITLTIRPIGSTVGLLVGSIIKGPRGYPGGRGDLGDKGDPGVGGAGTPGIVWKGAFPAGSPYTPGNAVSVEIDGITSSYICKQATAVSPPDPVYWDLLAEGSAGTTFVGMSWQGAWVSGDPYVVGNAVSDTVLGVTSSYICIADVTSAANPGTDLGPDNVGGSPGGHWDIIAQAASASGETPVYASVPLTGNVVPVTKVAPYVLLDATYVAGGGADGSYTAGGSPGDYVAKTATEIKISSTTGTLKKLVFLHAVDRAIFKGKVTLYLPQVVDGASINWTTDNVRCIVTIDNYNTEGSPPVDLAKVTATAATAYFIIEVSTTAARKVTTTLIGMAAAA